MRDNDPRSSGVSYTNVNQNSTGATTVYDPDNDAFVYGAYVENVGSSAIMLLEVTDGSSTGKLTPGQSAGGDIAFGDTLELSGAQSLAVNVTTANTDTVDANETVTVSHSET